MNHPHEIALPSRHFALFLLAVLFAASPAVAQPAAAPPAAALPTRAPPAVVPPAAAAAAPAPGVPMQVASDAITTTMQDDASNDRGLVFPHAGTIGAGKWSLNSYELVFLGFTYGIDDATQLSATTLLPMFEGMPLVVALQLKRHILRTDLTVVSMMANLNVGRLSAGSTASIFAGTFGGIIAIDHYTDNTGKVGLHASLSLNGVFAGGSESQTQESVFEVDTGAFSAAVGGISFKVSDSMKLLSEVALPLSVSNKGVSGADFLFLAYGARFHGRTLAVDLSFIRPLGGGVGSGLVLGIPWVAFSYRPL